MKNQDKLVLKKIINNILEEDFKFNNKIGGSFDREDVKKIPHSVDIQTIKVLKKVFEHYNCDLDESYVVIGRTMKGIKELLSGDTIEISAKGEPVIHLLPPSEKKKTSQIQDFLAGRNAKNNKKLMMHDLEGNPTGVMPMAKYNFYKRYGLGDSRNINGNVISEETLKGMGNPDHIHCLGLFWYDENARAFIAFGNDVVYASEEEEPHHSMIYECISYFTNVPLNDVRDIINTYVQCKRLERTDTISDASRESLITTRNIAYRAYGKDTYDRVVECYNSQEEWKRKATLFGRVWINCNDGKSYVSIWAENRFFGVTKKNTNNSIGGSDSDDYSTQMERNSDNPIYDWEVSSEEESSSSYADESDDQENNLELLEIDKLKQHIVDNVYMYDFGDYEYVLVVDKDKIVPRAKRKSGQAGWFEILSPLENNFFVKNIRYISHTNEVFLVDYVNGQCVLYGKHFDRISKNALGEKDYMIQESWGKYLEAENADDIEVYECDDSDNVFFSDNGAYASESLWVHDGEYEEVDGQVDTELGNGILLFRDGTIFSLYCGEIVRNANDYKYDGGDYIYITTEDIRTNQPNWIKYNIYDGEPIDGNEYSDANHFHNSAVEGMWEDIRKSFWKQMNKLNEIQKRNKQEIFN